MCKVLAKSLFIKNKKKYKTISECVTRFNSFYNKNPIHLPQQHLAVIYGGGYVSRHAYS